MPQCKVTILPLGTELTTQEADIVELHGSEYMGKIETWAGGNKQEAKIEKVSAKTFVSYKANIQIIKVENIYSS